eukprot:1457821-Amphidinium_carterae.1
MCGMALCSYKGGLRTKGLLYKQRSLYQEALGFLLYGGASCTSLLYIVWDVVFVFIRGGLLLKGFGLGRIAIDAN